MAELRDHENMRLVWFNLLTDTGFVKAFYTTKEGGVSSGVYESMNLSFDLGDDKEKVKQNFRILAETTGIDYDKITLSSQVHETNVRVIREEDVGKGLMTASDFTSVDAMVTNISKVSLVTRYADCLPILIFDPVKKVIAAAHGGWRGTVGNILSKTLSTMQSVFDSNPADVLLAFGPAICMECYEIGEEVLKVFLDQLGEYICIEECIKACGEQKYKMDLKEVNKRLALKAGVKLENIEECDLCTMCRRDLFFSHRIQGLNRGSQVAVICLI